MSAAGPGLRAARAGSAAILPMLLGVVPFGLVAGASAPARGLGGAAAVGFSTIVFAGASQLAAIDVLGGGGTALVATVAAWTINLRMLLYSASLAPYLSDEPFGRRLLAAYFLTDQAYAVSIDRWSRLAEDPPGTRLPYYLGAGVTLWAAWQAATVAGALAGAALPSDLPLDFAVPLVFLVLLVPTMTAPPAVVAALTAGATAVLVAELGATDLAIVAGALTGIVAGVAAELVSDRTATSPGGSG
jgi:predicted branched-subunit amino acid permease